jgi:hypothetical protein
MATLAEQRLAYRAGRMAARIGKDLATCPYPADQRLLRLWFIRGYRSWETRTT